MRHPLHPALVHFPVACWTLAVVADVASLRFGETAWQWTSGLLATGCIMALVAALAGLLEIVRVPEGAAMRDAYVHMAAMFLALALFAWRLMLEPYDFQSIAPGTLGLTLDTAGLLVMIIGAWFGGRLVYGHGVGAG